MDIVIIKLTYRYYYWPVSVLRATTKKGRENPGYAYEFAHPLEKILRAPMIRQIRLIMMMAR